MTAVGKKPSRFTGRYYRGAMAEMRRAKRAQADERNARTLPQKRRAYWRELADVEPVPDVTGPCQWPWKTAYPNQAAVAAARCGMQRHRKQQGLHPYPCPAGHWHLGRLLRRASVAWRAAA